LGAITLDPDFIISTEVTGHFSGSASHIAVAKTRVIFSSIFVFIGLAGAIWVSVFRRKFKAALPVLVIALAPLVFLPLSGHYGDELLHRLYLFGLPAMAFFGATLLGAKRKIVIIVLCLLLIIGVPLHVISHYGNQELDYFPPTQTAGLDFFDGTTSYGYVTGASPLGQINNITHYPRLGRGFDQLDWQGDMLTIKTSVKQEIPHYIGIGRYDRAYYEWLRGDSQFIADIEQSLDSAVNCALVYTNPDFRLYVNEEGYTEPSS
jgi:hypothetical protein